MTEEPTACIFCHGPLRPCAVFCPACGTAVAGAPATSTRRGRLVALVTAAALLAAAVVVAILLVIPRSAPAATAGPAPEPSYVAPTSVPTSSPSTAASPQLTPVTAIASCSRPPGQDASGDPTSYEPERAVDGNPTTAWRCDGDGVGQSLTLAFTEPVELGSVAIIGGFAKTDPYDGTDRYAQNRRISRVRLTFDDASPVEAQLDTSASNRATQTIPVGDVVTRTVVVTVLGSTPGTEQNAQPPQDSVAISEIRFS